MKKLLFIAVLALCGFALDASQTSIVVSGYISNSSGDPVSDVSIKCIETSFVAQPSDFEGFYSISVPASRKNTLEFSHPDYQTQTRTVNSSSSVSLDVDMGLYSGY